MSSHIAIVESLRRAAADGERVVLATVVRVVGSSYGGVGARMVIRVDGSTVGLVSGGCLESDLCSHAVDVHVTGVPRVVTYDARADDDAIWGLGLGCNGLIDVLLQALSPEHAGEVAALLEGALRSDEPSVIVTVVASSGGAASPHVGAQARLTSAGATASTDWTDDQLLDAARAHYDNALASGRRGMVHPLGCAVLAFEVVTPAIRLVVCGAGPDAAPLCRLARGLGWDVTIVDHRLWSATRASRFEGARVVDSADARVLAEAVSLCPRTAAVVMSHHFARDTDYVSALLHARVAYIGVLGPRARTERMLAELAARGDTPPAGDGALFGPVGLDLGGDGPESIALAIVAEVSAVMHQRGAAHLRAEGRALHALASD